MRRVLFTPVLRLDGPGRLIRLVRFEWNVGLLAYKLSLGLAPRVWRVDSDRWGWQLFILGVRIHYRCCGGGRPAPTPRSRWFPWVGQS